MLANVTDFHFGFGEQQLRHKYELGGGKTRNRRPGTEHVALDKLTANEPVGSAVRGGVSCCVHIGFGVRMLATAILVLQQSDSWGADVGAIAWVPRHNALVVTTSEIYGTSSVYILNLEKQVAAKLGQPKDCGSTIESINEHSVTIGINDCEHATPTRSLVFAFPPGVPGPKCCSTSRCTRPIRL